MRARNIKPGFFANEDLAECSPWARLCFAGLWLMADRAGRLEDRPKRIKGELFRFDSIDVDPLLDELQKHGFIQRYVVDGLGIIQILAFNKHQNPHHREPESDLPPPQSPRLTPLANPQKPRAEPGFEGVEAQGKPRASPGNDPQDSTCQGGQAVLIPDSGFLIPDSPFRIPDSGEPSASPRGATREREPSPRPSRRCPESFDVDDDMRAWASDEVPGVDIDRETRAFRDHEFAKPRSDWRATWRNWMRTASKSAGPGRAAGRRETTEEFNRRSFAEWLGEPPDDGRTIDA